MMHVIKAILKTYGILDASNVNHDRDQKIVNCNIKHPPGNGDCCVCLSKMFVLSSVHIAYNAVFYHNFPL